MPAAPRFSRSGPLGELGGAPGLLGGVDRGGADGHHRRFGGAGDGHRLVDPLLQLAQQRRRRPLGQHPVLGVVALGTLHSPQFTGEQAANPASAGKPAGRLDFRLPQTANDPRSSLRNPRDFFQPLAIGAPEPLREIPVKPSRMIHFLDFSNEKMVAKAARIAEKTDILLGNLEDAIPVDRKEAARARA